VKVPWSVPHLELSLPGVNGLGSEKSSSRPVSGPVVIHMSTHQPPVIGYSPHKPRAGIDHGLLHLRRLKKELILFFNSTFRKPPQAGRAYKIRKTITEYAFMIMVLDWTITCKVAHQLFFSFTFFVHSMWSTKLTIHQLFTVC